jgi:hypothetical protein
VDEVLGRRGILSWLLESPKGRKRRAFDAAWSVSNPYMTEHRIDVVQTPTQLPNTSWSHSKRRSMDSPAKKFAKLTKARVSKFLGFSYHSLNLLKAACYMNQRFKAIERC